MSCCSTVVEQGLDEVAGGVEEKEELEEEIRTLEKKQEECELAQRQVFVTVCQVSNRIIYATFICLDFLCYIPHGNATIKQFHIHRCTSIACKTFVALLQFFFCWFANLAHLPMLSTLHSLPCSTHHAQLVLFTHCRAYSVLNSMYHTSKLVQPKLCAQGNYTL